ncbi:MAG: response regulator [Acidobacteria bacterium]|nr:response regulator [Acidobacteriota bacterium]
MQTTVLVVDDDQQLLPLLAAFLRDSGFDVLCADTAASALEISMNATRLDLVFTDFELPGRDGLQLARDLLGDRPDLPVLFMTGNPAAFDEIVAAGFPCLIKPFVMAELTAALDDALNSSDKVRRAARDKREGG